MKANRRTQSEHKFDAIGVVGTRFSPARHHRTPEHCHQSYRWRAELLPVDPVIVPDPGPVGVSSKNRTSGSMSGPNRTIFGSSRASAALQDIATNTLSVSSNFYYRFSPLTMTLFTFAPGPSSLAVLQMQSTNIQLQLRGQPGVTYTIQATTNLTANNWLPVATNLLTGTTTNLAISTAPASANKFYRAVWVP